MNFHTKLECLSLASFSSLFKQTLFLITKLVNYVKSFIKLDPGVLCFFNSNNCNTSVEKSRSNKRTSLFYKRIHVLRKKSLMGDVIRLVSSELVMGPNQLERLSLVGLSNNICE
jgi:hypothetical protein